MYILVYMNINYVYVTKQKVKRKFHTHSHYGQFLLYCVWSREMVEVNLFSALHQTLTQR